MSRKKMMPRKRRLRRKIPKGWNRLALTAFRRHIPTHAVFLEEQSVNNSVDLLKEDPLAIPQEHAVDEGDNGIVDPKLAEESEVVIIDVKSITGRNEEDSIDTPQSSAAPKCVPHPRKFNLTVGIVPNFGEEKIAYVVTKFICPETDCSFESPNAERVIEHFEAKHFDAPNLKLFRCPACWYRYTNAEILMMHVSLYHFVGDSCFICKKTFWEHSLLVSHVRQHQTPTGGQLCNVCNEPLIDHANFVLGIEPKDLICPKKYYAKREVPLV